MLTNGRAFLVLAAMLRSLALRVGLIRGLMAVVYFVIPEHFNGLILKIAIRRLAFRFCLDVLFSNAYSDTTALA